MEGGPSTYQAKKHSIEEQTARNEKKRNSVTGEETRRCSSGVSKAGKRDDEAQQNKSHPPTIVETSRLQFIELRMMKKPARQNT
jgi:hypothetical protein